MEKLAIIAVVLICFLCMSLQHLFNKWIRKGTDDGEVGGWIGIIISYVILGLTIYNAIFIFGSSPVIP